MKKTLIALCALVLVVVLVVGCSGGEREVQGTYRIDADVPGEDYLLLELKPSGVYEVRSGSGTHLEGKYTVEGDTVVLDIPSEDIATSSLTFDGYDLIDDNGDRWERQ